MTRSCAAALLTISAIACGGESNGMPREWGPLALGESERCPAVAGRYFEESSPVAWALASAHVTQGPDHEPAAFELAGDADSALHLTVVDVQGVRDSARLTKGTPYSGDYHCDDGWLHANHRHIPDQWDDAVDAPGFVVRRRALRIAPGAHGALVGRLDGTDYDEFTIWCGDGCKGIPLPWTFRTRSSWSAVDRWDPARARKPVQAATSVSNEGDRSRNEALLREEQLLEHGPLVAGQGDARQRALAALPPGMLLKAVSPRDSGWHLSVEFPELPVLERFMVGLSQSGPVAEVRILPHYRAKTTQGQWVDVVYVRYAPAGRTTP
ncbi:MAG: hypothetical protein H7066_23425 [Cytophagaceae bacterium]|nr:hypothetical protein [Gemmatimonadaceae bacterium]